MIHLWSQSSDLTASVEVPGDGDVVQWPAFLATCRERMGMTDISRVVDRDMAEVEEMSEVLGTGGPHVLCVSGTFSPDGPKEGKQLGPGGGEGGGGEGKGGGEAGERKEGGGGALRVTYFHAGCPEDRRRQVIGGQERWNDFVSGLEEALGKEVRVRLCTRVPTCVCVCVVEEKRAWVGYCT